VFNYLFMWNISCVQKKQKTELILMKVMSGVWKDNDTWFWEMATLTVLRVWEFSGYFFQNWKINCLTNKH
ncbi:TPA: hypothetical protein ACH0S9_004855, partial [Citrobacter werkmanii]